MIDAVAHLGIRHIDMPMSPQRVWEAITAAKAGHPADPWREPPEIFATLAAEADIDSGGVAAAEGI